MKIKRLFTFAASLATFLLTFAQTPWDGSVATEFAGGDGSQQSPYEIETPAQLALLAHKVNEGDLLTGVYFIQIADLDLNGSEQLQWIPISNRYNRYFGGNYDGAGHKITNFYINDTDDSTTNICSLFGNCTNDCTITGIVIDGKINTKSGYAGIVSFTNGSITDCVSLLDINLNEKGKGGGIVSTSGGAVERCIFAGKVFGGFMGSGIVADNRGSVSECLNIGQMEGSPQAGSSMTAGIVTSNSGSVQNCINAGSVFGYYNCGGVTASQNGTLSDCINVGPVFGYNSCGAVTGTGTGTSHLYYDVQTASGLLTGEKYYDSKENLRVTTASFISGDESMLSFTDVDKWAFTEGSYPQLKAFCNSDSRLVRQLSALGAVPAVAADNDVWAALTGDISIPATINYQGGSDNLVWSSETPDIINISGTTARFTEPGKDSDMTFTATIDGTDIRRVFRHYHYEVFSTMEVPEYTMKGGVKSYKMKNIGNFAWVCALTNGLRLAVAGDKALPAYSNFQNCELEMVDDIDFGGHNWVPIAGLNSEARSFGGKISGNGHTIKNLTIDRNGEPCMALIARLVGGEGIHDIRLAGGSVVSGGEDAASLVGMLYLTDMTGCINESCTVKGDYKAAGLASTVRGGSITRCANMADVSSDSHYAGGIAAIFNSDDSRYSTMSECFNTGAVNATKGRVGGVAAVMGIYSTIDHCYNMGEITADGDFIGGITCAAGSDMTVHHCYNAGAVRKPKGFLGKVNVGEILGTGEGAMLKNNYYDSNTGVAGGGIAGNDRIGVSGMTTEELQSQETIAKLGTSYFCEDTDGMNGGYPVLSWYKAMVGTDMTTVNDADGNALTIHDGTISCNVPCTALAIYNAASQPVAKSDGSAISASSLYGGIYIAVAITADGKRISAKFIINH